MNNIVGNYGNRSVKAKLFIKFELSDGSFTSPQLIQVTKQGEWIGMGSSQKPVSNKYVHSNLCYWWGEVPDNAVAFRYVVDFSETFENNQYSEQASFMFSSPVIRGI